MDWVRSQHVPWRWINLMIQEEIIYTPKEFQDFGAPWWLGWLSGCLPLRSWSQGPRIKPHILLPALWGVCFSLSLCLPLPWAHECICFLSQINKILKKKKDFQDISKMYINRNWGTFVYSKGIYPNVVDWIELIDIRTLPRDSGFNVSVHEAGGGSNIFLGWSIRAWTQCWPTFHEMTCQNFVGIMWRRKCTGLGDKNVGLDLSHASCVPSPHLVPWRPLH